MTPLRQRMLEDMQLRGLSPKTQGLYIWGVSQLAEYYDRSPDQISEEEVRAFFLHLKNERQLSRSSCNVILCGIKFLYEYTLKRRWPVFELIRPKKEHKLPVVLSQEEVSQILGSIQLEHYRVCLGTIYSRAKGKKTAMCHYQNKHYCNCANIGSRIDIQSGFFQRDGGARYRRMPMIRFRGRRSLRHSKRTWLIAG